MLPDSKSWMLNGISYMGNRLRFTVQANADCSIELTSKEVNPLVVTYEGHTVPFEINKPIHICAGVIVLQKEIK